MSFLEQPETLPTDHKALQQPPDQGGAWDLRGALGPWSTGELLCGLRASQRRKGGHPEHTECQALLLLWAEKEITKRTSPIPPPGCSPLSRKSQLPLTKACQVSIRISQEKYVNETKGTSLALFNSSGLN